MNKKHLVGIIIVVLVSASVLFTDLRSTPLKKILNTGTNINYWTLFLVFALMLLSYVCEASILATLSGQKKSFFHSKWSFFRIPLIQALFNAITPLSTGGQPAQLAAMLQMGIEGGRATSLLLMKFIIYQVVVFCVYLASIIFGFHLIATRFMGLAVFIVIGLLIHVVSTLFLLAVMFAYHWTKNISNKVMNLLTKFLSPQRVEKWRRAIMTKIVTFYTESQRLKRKKTKLLLVTALTVGQMLCFYSIPYFLLVSLHVSTSWFAVTQMNVMIIMFMAIIPLPGASGGAEFSFQTLFSTFITNKSSLILAMFLWRFATYFFGMILGIIAWIFKPKKVNLKK